MAQSGADPAGEAGTTGPIPSVPLPPAMLADERAREAKYGTAPLSSTAVADAAMPAAPASPQPPSASGRPRIFDASEGTRLDPLLNKTYDLSYAKVVPQLQSADAAAKAGASNPDGQSLAH